MTFEDPAQLEFRRRPAQRPRRMQPFSSQSIWLGIAIIAAIVFLLLVRAMLERSEWTAGRSTDAAIAAPYVPTDAELKAQDWPAMPEPVAPDQGVFPTPEEGPRVYRCVGKHGEVSFQSQPCGDGQKTTRVVEATPDRSPARGPRLYQPPPDVRAVQGYDSPAPGGSSERDQRRARCQQARQYRDDTLRRVGLSRTFDLLRQLDAQVYEACKGL